MTRIGKQEERRHKCPKKHKHPLSIKTGPKKEASLKNKENTVDSSNTFIPKIR
jgi:hypothetical protein